MKTAWIVWILAFVGLEVVAMNNDKVGDTLSENIRDWIGTDTKKRTVWMWAARAGVLGGLLWLVPHLLTGSI